LFGIVVFVKFMGNYCCRRCFTRDRRSVFWHYFISLVTE